MKSAVVAALQVASPRRTVTSGLLQRQCACGSRAGSSGKCEGCSKKRIVGLQTKMQVGHPSDAFEQEADRVADQVIATLADSAITSLPPRIQRFMGRFTGKTEDISASVDQVPASPGRPLDPALQRDMEQRFGHDFSKVRVHTGTQAEQSARQVNAHAYTVGQAMIFGQGRYEPETNEGRRLIVHELAHVVQQSRGGPPPGLVHEADAERVEAQMVRGAGCIQVVEASRVGVARQPEEIALEDAWEELQKVRKDLDNYVISLDAKAKLNTKRQHLERLLYGETKEQSQVRLLRNIGILPGGKIKEPTPISLLTREELAALPAKRFFVEQADREKVLRSKPISDGGRVTKALAEMGQMYQRPFTNFEVKLKSDKEFNITEEGVDGVKQFAVPSESVQPIYSYDKKKVVAYRAGYRLLDANGQTQQAVEHGIEPAVGPLDLVELLVPFGVPVAKVAIREAGLLGRALLRETAEQAPRQLRRLGRTLVAATIALEESGAAPRMASTLGSRGPRALIVKQIDKAAEAPPKQIGKQVGKVATPAAKEAVKDTVKKAAQELDQVATSIAKTGDDAAISSGSKSVAETGEKSVLGGASNSAAAAEEKVLAHHIDGPDIAKNLSKFTARELERLAEEGRLGKEIDDAIDTMTRPKKTGKKSPRIEDPSHPKGSRSVSSRPAGEELPRKLDLEDLPRRANETARDALTRVKRVAGRELKEIPDLAPAWETVREAALKKYPAPKNAKEARALFDKVRGDFWESLKTDKKHKKLKEFYEESGYAFPAAKGRAPQLAGVDPAIPEVEKTISLDHIKEIRGDYSQALDANNLKMEFSAPNTKREITQMRHPELKQ